jgi:hypothetical protein
MFNELSRIEHALGVSSRKLGGAGWERHKEYGLVTVSGWTQFWRATYDSQAGESAPSASI